MKRLTLVTSSDFGDSVLKNRIDHQRKHNDCGISAVKTICNILKVDLPREYIESSIEIDFQGTHLEDIAQFFKAHHFEADYKLLDLNLTDNAYYQALTPFILPVKRKKEIHFVVVQQVKNGKVKILDPAVKSPYWSTFSEVKKMAFLGESELEYLSTTEKITALVEPLLHEYDIPLKKALEVQSLTDLFNSATYFLYMKESFGFKDFNSEKAFLHDLIFNQEIKHLPKSFRTTTLKKETIKLRAPVILTVKIDDQSALNRKIHQLQTEKPASKNIYWQLFTELGKYQKIWGYYLLMVVIAGSFIQLSVFINQYLIDHILVNKNSAVILAFGIGVLFYQLLNLIMSLSKSWLGIILSKAIDEIFLVKFDQKLNDYSLSYIQSYKKGDLTERLNDSTRLKSFFMRFFTNLLMDSFIVIYTLAILFWLDWKLTFIVIAVIILYIIWFYIITPYLQQNEHTRFLRKADFFSRMFEKLDGIQTLKSGRFEHHFSKKIRENIENLLAIGVRSKKTDLVNRLVVSLISIIATILIMTISAYQAVTFDLMTTGQVITYIALSGKVFSSLGALLEENLSLQENQIILQRYFAFEERSEEETQASPNTETSNHSLSPGIIANNHDSNHDHNSAHQRGTINPIHTLEPIQSLELKDISYRYRLDKKALDSINFTIHQHDKIRLIGANGSGKTTLCKILAFLYPPLSGELLINGKAHTEYDYDALKEKSILVSNEDTLFFDTFRYNVTFGREVSSKKIAEMLDLLTLTSLVESHEEGLDFMISENGKNLSTGQRKKILLLRALLHPAEIVILDEVLSGIDADSRKRIENYLNSIDRTFIIISHEDIEHIQFTQEWVL
ncbi:ABC transporter transmembrane domain-containing protein [Ignatzschineria sp. LJL83]